MRIESYVIGAWTPGQGDGVEVRNAITGEPVGIVDRSGIDFADVLQHGRDTGGQGSALRGREPRPERASRTGLAAGSRHRLGGVPPSLRDAVPLVDADRGDHLGAR